MAKFQTVIKQPNGAVVVTLVDGRQFEFESVEALESQVQIDEAELTFKYGLKEHLESDPTLSNPEALKNLEVTGSFATTKKTILP
jgi:Tfp pilus assembly pilus retraction ATPase PilT